jgi:hypothetical protein
VVHSVRDKLPFVAPTSDYLNFIKQAAAEFDFPVSQREMLERVPVMQP